ncbi:hypothetical protein BDY24DRAFT_369149 [Mrakia frigida]|uniref:uncharacterized protein n=1 Tax=Mrakia frigida TaxID=29902 RepID=UPI003FCC1770
MDKATHGGARKGSGRKPSEKKKKSASTNPPPPPLSLHKSGTGAGPVHSFFKNSALSVQGATPSRDNLQPSSSSSTSHSSFIPQVPHPAQATLLNRIPEPVGVAGSSTQPDGLVAGSNQLNASGRAQNQPPPDLPSITPSTTTANPTPSSRIPPGLPINTPASSSAHSQPSNRVSPSIRARELADDLAVNGLQDEPNDEDDDLLDRFTPEFASRASADEEDEEVGVPEGDGGVEESDELEGDFAKSYLFDFMNKIKKETGVGAQIPPKIYAAGQLIHRAVHPLFGYSKFSHQKSPSAFYSRDIFVWIPHLLPNSPQLRCPQPGCNQPLSFFDYNRDPPARRVRALENDYYLFTVRYICKKSPLGCGSTLQGTDQRLIASLPRSLQLAFPILPFARSAVDQTVVDILLATSATRFGPTPLAGLLNELRALDHDRKELLYYDLLRQLTSSEQEQVKSDFSSFKDRAGFDGRVVSPAWMTSILLRQDLVRGPILDRTMASKPAKIIGADASYKVLKRMATTGGKANCTGLFTVTNELGQVRGATMFPSKALVHLTPLLDGINAGLPLHGHSLPEVIYTDNVDGDLSLFEASFPSISNNVEHVASNKHSSLPPLPIPTLNNLQVTSDTTRISQICHRILQDIDGTQDSIYVGFDLEWKVDSNGRGGVTALAGDCRVDVLQIAWESMVYVFQISNFSTPSTAPHGLIALLQNSGVVKCGRGVSADLLRISKLWQLNELRTRLEGKSSVDFVDVGAFAKLKGAVTSAKSSLEDVTAVVLRHSLPKETSIRLSDWSQPQLTPPQVEYAARDAVAGLAVWSALSSLDSVGLPLKSSAPGTLVGLRSGKTTVAFGRIVEQVSPFLASQPFGQEQKQIPITSSRIVVEISEIIQPGHMVALHGRLPLSQLGPLPFQIIVQRQTLLTRAEKPPTETSPLDLRPALPPSNPTVPPPELPSQELLAVLHSSRRRSSSESGKDVEDESSSDSDSDSDSEEEMENEEPRTANLARDDDEELYGDDMDFNEEAWEAIKTHDAPASTSNPTLSLPHSTTPSSTSNNPQPSRSNFPSPRSYIQSSDTSLPSKSNVKLDVVHAMFRVEKEVSKAHTAHKAFLRALSETLLVYDAGDRAEVEDLAKATGWTWEELKQKKGKWLKKRVRRFIPESEVLAANLVTLLNGWKDVEDMSVKTRGKLLRRRARKAMENLIELVRKGYLSDPPVPLYYILRTDQQGYTVYRCVRGTNVIEGGIHKNIVRSIGANNAGMPLMVALLRNFTSRLNKNVEIFNTTGRKHVGHFDESLCDEVSSFALELGLNPSIPIPLILSTQIATSETFFITPMPNSVVKELNFRQVASPSLPLPQTARIRTAVVPPNVFMAQRQQLEFAVLPIQNVVERQLLSKLIGTGSYHQPSSSNKKTKLPDRRGVETYNLKKLALAWTEEVHKQPSNDLYYKLPEMLASTLSSWVEKGLHVATLASSIDARQPHTKLLTSPSYQATVLPAVPLPVSLPKPTPVTPKGKKRAAVELDEDEEESHHASGSRSSSSLPVSSISHINILPLHQQIFQLVRLRASLDPLQSTRPLPSPLPLLQQPSSRNPAIGRVYHAKAADVHCSIPVGDWGGDIFVIAFTETVALL